MFPFPVPKISPHFLAHLANQHDFPLSVNTFSSCFYTYQLNCLCTCDYFPGFRKGVYPEVYKQWLKKFTWNVVITHDLHKLVCNGWQKEFSGSRRLYQLVLCPSEIVRNKYTFFSAMSWILSLPYTSISEKDAKKSNLSVFWILSSLKCKSSFLR